MPETVDVSIVPHTHWDREWYAPFQAYRLQLVHLVDGLLDLLESDPAYARFLLDGQTALVDDYLEIRPEARERLERLVRAGRVQVGPWMVLMDEFMVSGETIVRDLQMGLARTRELGGVADVGYLPDMFGHVAQMPQLLRLAGIHHAVVWRGVPAAIERTGFWWVAPDGSRVRAEYLYGSYSNGRDLTPAAPDLVARARGYVAELGDAALPGGPVLLMNGSDHLQPQPHLGALVATTNAGQDEFHFTIRSLAEHVCAQSTDGLHTWEGELRSGARANVLMGVASNRVDVHQLCAAAERAIERRAEPLSALFLPRDAYPHALLHMAWRNLVLNSAHDSSCACSHDEVVEAVRVRYQEARHIGEALADDALQRLAAEIDAPAGSHVAVNATSRARGGLVAVRAAGTGPAHLRALDDGSVHAAQQLGEIAGTGLDTVVTGTKIRWVVEMMRGPELAGARIARVEHHTGADGTVEYTFHDAGPGEPVIDLEATRDELLALGARGTTIAIRQRRAPVRELVARVGHVPPFGWRTFEVVEGPVPLPAGGGAHAEGLVLRNELVRVEVHPDDGTCTIEADGVRVAGTNRYVDGGDGGDTYNYSPPALDTVVDQPHRVDVDVVDPGPASARLLVTSHHRWPSHAIGDEHSCSRRSDDFVDVAVRTTYELRARERFVRVHVELDNRARDHRLRAHVPLPRPVAGSDAECAFAVVRRGLTAEGGPHERGLPTFVSRRFVDCSADGEGLALLHDGLLEYEVVDEGAAVALTLLRATGYLSRSEPAYRPNPAGPLHTLRGPQLQGLVEVDYALLPHRGDWRDARLPEAADDFLVPLEGATVPRPGGHDEARRRASTGTALSVEGASVSAVLRDSSGASIVRLVNLSPERAPVAVGWYDDAHIEPVDLAGNVVDSEGPGMRPWEVLTLRSER